MSNWPDKLIRPQDLLKVNVDTTVQPKAIAFPTDSRLYSKITGKLPKAARNAGVVLRQSYFRITKYALIMQGRYAKPRQINRARKCQKKLHTNLGRLTRDISRKLEGNPDAGKRQNLIELLAMADRLLQQTRTTSKKLYSLHEPDVENIAKGKPHRKYEFGNKVSLVVTSQRSLIVGVKALHGNPYDGHTLVGAIRQSVCRLRMWSRSTSWWTRVIVVTNIRDLVWFILREEFQRWRLGHFGRC